MIPSLIYLALCLIAGYGLVRLGALCDRVEADKLARLQAAIDFNEEASPNYWAFVKDLAAAVLLSVLFLACLYLAFGLGR